MYNIASFINSHDFRLFICTSSVTKTAQVKTRKKVTTIANTSVKRGLSSADSASRKASRSFCYCKPCRTIRLHS